MRKGGLSMRVVVIGGSGHVGTYLIPWRSRSEFL